MNPSRKSTRLPGYDYRTPALYHVVNCTHNRICRFGVIQNGEMYRNQIGDLIQEIWLEIPEVFPAVSLDLFVLMPNHHHGLIFIEPPSDGQATTSLIDVVRWFKSMTTVRYSRGVRAGRWTPYDHALWQRSFYDHVVRDDHDLMRIREYIENNPATWSTDSLYVEG